MKDTKKQWVKPELVILLRNKPEETILSPCKWIGSNNPPGFIDGGCQTFPDDPQCTPCNVVSDS